ncbi:D-alanyl-D-alanine carboxypeptidase family protein [Gracilibacillus sp. YIM 98692]|uniref:D-alanyl-D-alanine carboxypeptidase family protein n=1 Tax=Gracilibacillus sp. YIM 98692 TaxID=2663532 RepID=UPI0013D304A4|nr:D-alanyl-D-alanine carboxypeptidase family protein [Gracilibacillus sp. YIM 98692]
MIKKIVLLLTICFIILGKNNVYADTDNQQIKTLSENIYHKIHAKSWVVLDQKTGQVLLQKDMNKRQYPASITKIATTIYAIEQGNINDSINVSESAVKTIGSSLYLHEGDKFKLKDLLYGIMLHSGNDGAVAIAEHIAESERLFAEKVTSFAQSIGAKNTNFTNASGLHNENHYTSAYDMATIARYAMKNPLFREIASSKTYQWNERYWTDELKIHVKDDANRVGYQWDDQNVLVNHNHLLFNYEGATGIKNGFTNESLYTLVGSAKRGNRELIVAVLRSIDRYSAYQDATILLDEGFHTYRLFANDEKGLDKKDSKTAKQSVTDRENFTFNRVEKNFKSLKTLKHMKKIEKEKTVSFKWQWMINGMLTILILILYKFVVLRKR